MYNSKTKAKCCILCRTSVNHLQKKTTSIAVINELKNIVFDKSLSMVQPLEKKFVKIIKIQNLLINHPIANYHFHQDNNNLMYKYEVHNLM
jgi:hypothetical protein